MSDLVEFLTARLDEDQQAAKDAHYEGQHWLSEEEDVWRWPDDEPVYTADRKRDAAHIVRWQPARALADVDSKRRILARVAEDGMKAWSPKAQAASTREWFLIAACRDVLKLLALPYAEHPDYRQEWTP